MKLPFCPHEERVAELLNENRWPWAADPALLDHARKCGRCSNVVFAVQILQQSRSATVLAAHAGSPDYLWWRAQLRLQNSAVEQITKPVVWAEKLALIGMLCVAGGFLVRQWGHIGDWISGLADIFNSQAFRLSAVWLHSTFEGNLIGYSMLAGLAAIACIGGLTLFLSDPKG
jgi:hypothetical protein